MTTVEGSAMLELFVNPTYAVEEFVQQFAVLETSTFVVAQTILLVVKGYHHANNHGGTVSRQRLNFSLCILKCNATVCLGHCGSIISGEG